MKITASAPGKIALFGEHAVVYGKPAIVSSIDKRIYVTIEERSDDDLKISAMDLHIPGIILTYRKDQQLPKVETNFSRVEEAISYVQKGVYLASEYCGKRKGVNVEVRSEMPVGAGLGTSAALSVATAYAYLTLLGVEIKRESLAELGHKIEVAVQGSASPMDTAVACFGGLLQVTPLQTGPSIERIGVNQIPGLVIGYTARETTTAELLKRVRSLRSSFPEAVESIMSAIGSIVSASRRALERGDLASLGELMNINHGLLESLGVSTKRLNDMVYSARYAGALGSKLTGAGGGGCMIALSPSKESAVKTAIQVAGGMPLAASLSDIGAKIED